MKNYNLSLKINFDASYCKTDPECGRTGLPKIFSMSTTTKFQHKGQFFLDCLVNASHRIIFVGNYNNDQRTSYENLNIGNVIVVDSQYVDNSMTSIAYVLDLKESHTTPPTFLPIVCDMLKEFIKCVNESLDDPNTFFNTFLKDRTDPHSKDYEAHCNNMLASINCKTSTILFTHLMKSFNVKISKEEFLQTHLTTIINQRLPHIKISEVITLLKKSSLEEILTWIKAIQQIQCGTSIDQTQRSHLQACEYLLPSGLILFIDDRIHEEKIAMGMPMTEMSLICTNVLAVLDFYVCNLYISKNLL